MKQKHDIGAMVLAAMLLLVCVTYLTQCRSTSESRQTVAAATATAGTHAESREEELERERGGKRKSVREFAAEEEREEREKVKDISRALQTAGANPEFRRTYGFPE